MDHFRDDVLCLLNVIFLSKTNYEGSRNSFPKQNSGDSEGFFGPKKNPGRVAGKPQKRGEQKGGNSENPNLI
jgi:hypothetical protein